MAVIFFQHSDHPIWRLNVFIIFNRLSYNFRTNNFIAMKNPTYIRKIFLLFFFISSTLCVYPQSVDQRIKEIALESYNIIVGESEALSSADISDKHDLLFNSNYSASVVKFKSGGFIIVSPYDKENLVLGYSYRTDFNMDNIPETLLNFLKLAGENNDSKPRLLVSQKEIKAFNSRLRKISSNNDIEPLIKTTWHQISPYNFYCPEGSVAGCNAVAMGQLINYWEYPEYGIGKKAYFSNPLGGLLSVDFSAQSYDYSQMPDVVGQANYDETAKLLYHAGVSINLQYGYGSTSGYFTDILDGLLDHFGYSSSMYWDRESNYEETGLWKEKVITEINKGVPLLYSGSKDGGGAGHSFIIDGYQSPDYFHINWGWGGYSDGYYLLGEFLDYNKDPYFIAGAVPSAIKANFTSQSLLTGTEDITVTFKDRSLTYNSQITSYLWDFGDGITSTEVNPVHTFTDPGSYDVSLTISDGNETDTHTKENFVNYVNSNSIIYVDIAGDDASGKGTSAEPYRTIQKAIEAAGEGSTIDVGPGEYFENISFLGKGISVIGNRGEKNTIINGGGSGSVVVFENQEDNNSVLSGFTIKNGFGNEIAQSWVVGTQYRSSGGGILLRDASSPVLENLIITENKAGFGAGIYCENFSGFILRKSKIINNETPEGVDVGSAVYPNSAAAFLHSSAVLFEDVRILNNVSIAGGTVKLGGGTLLLEGEMPRFVRVIFADNECGGLGSGGLTTERSQFFFDRVTMYNNKVTNDGSDQVHGNNLHIHGTEVEIKNSIIFSSEFKNLTVDERECANTILNIHHSLMNGGDDDIIANAVTTINYENNLDSDPILIDPEIYNFDLDPNSPCVGTGENGCNIGACDVGSTTNVYDSDKFIPITDKLSQNYPNPFNPTCKINYSLPKLNRVKIELYNALGELIKVLINEVQSPGNYTINFDGRNLSSGVYFYRLNTDSFTASRKMILLK